MTDAPRITFPCDYPVKIVGTYSDAFVDDITAIVRDHAPDLTAEQVSVKMSRKATYCSVTCVIVATGEQQLKALHEQLRTLDAVSVVL